MVESAQKSGDTHDTMGLAHLTSASAYIPQISRNLERSYHHKQTELSIGIDLPVARQVEMFCKHV